MINLPPRVKAKTTRLVAAGTDLPKEERKGAPYVRKGGPETRTNATGRSDGVRQINIPTGKPGNTKVDQTWIAEVDAKGLLRIIEDDRDVPFGVKTLYTGDMNDWGSAFRIPDDPNRCVGRAYVRDADGGKIINAAGEMLTRPCSSWKMRGSNVCGHHGGFTDGGKSAAQRRLMEAADMATGRLVRMIEAPDTDPAERLRAINSLLDRVGIKGGVEVTIETPAWQGMLKEMWETERSGVTPDPALGPKAPRRRVSASRKETS